MHKDKAEYADGSNDAYCSVGAIRHVAQNSVLAGRAERELQNYLNSQGAAGSIPGWNDNKERTLDEVREAFLMTAKRLRNGETD